MQHQQKKQYRKLASLTSAVLLALYGAATSAQGLALEEVIVTAQKRSESVQNIPSTVNVLNGETLKDFNVQSFTDLGSLSAGLRIDSLNGRSGRIVIRGVDFNPNSASEASVTTYWNQAIVDSNAVFQQMFDIERIEVLRGPQGTLAGRTSPAGSINIHTAKPNFDEQEGEVRATIADNDSVNTQIAASFPIIPGELAIRIAGVFDQSDLGEIKNDITGEVSHDESTAGRLSIGWSPSESFSADLTMQYLERELDDVIALEGTPTGNSTLQDPNGLLRELDAFDRRGAVVGLEDAEDNTDADFLNTSLVLNWTLENHTVTSVTGYHETNSIRQYDNSLGNANTENVAGRFAIDERDDFSQELRLASDGNDNWDYMIGVYYENSDIFFSQENVLIPIAPVQGSNILMFPAKVERWSLFTHNQFFLTDAWTLQLGLRYQEYDGDRDMFALAGVNGLSTFAPGDVLSQVLAEDNKNYKDDATTGQITLQYALSDDLNLYGLLSTGWRPAGVTVTGSALPEELLLFESEKSISYELGFKSTLMNGTLRLNGSLYYQQFDDYISRVNAINVTEADGNIDTTGFTTNGDAEVYGVELDMTAILSDRWSLGGTLSYNKSEYADGTELPCNQFDNAGDPVVQIGQLVAVCDVGGDAIGAAPDWAASINSQYVIPFDTFDGYGRILYTYTGERENISNIDGLDPYQVVNLYLGVGTEQWNVELFAENVLDEEALRGAGGTEATPLVRREATGYGQRFPIAARQIGVSASYRW
jgi:iron complex outermembrane receptor protein